jgi:hypothetical protein
LRSEPYVARTLDAQLTEATRRFIADSRFGARFDTARNELYVSSIFKWFKEDFVRLGKGNADAGVREFVATHSSAPQAAAIRTQAPRLRYLDYDWSLNDK